MSTGIDCGVAWCAPWEVDISKALKPGVNDCALHYTNNWYNRMVGDSIVPESERVTTSSVRCWRKERKGNKPTVWSGFCPNDPLQPSGLVGPITLKEYK